MSDVPLKDAMFLIPAFPFFGAAVLLVLGRRLKEPLGGLLATGMMGLSFITTLACTWSVHRRPVSLRQGIAVLFSWIPVGNFRADIEFNFDALAAVMCLVITGVGALIHLYSVGYMHGDRNFTRYFAYLNLFAGSMLVLVLANNFVLMFLGWEGVGLCSYLLIGFWFTRERAAVAAKKAFVTNRVGDVGFMVGTFLVFATFGTVTIGGARGGLSQVPTGAYQTSTLTAIGVLLLLRCPGH